MDGNAYITQVLNRHAVYPHLRLIAGSAHAIPVQNALEPMLRAWAGNYLFEIKPSGSCAKGTAISGTTDVDLFISLRSSTTIPLRDIYFSLDKFLKDRGYTTRQQNVSVGITHGTTLVDLVPGVKQHPLTDDHTIYRRKADTWTKTNIDKHISIVKNSGRWNEICATKIWREQNSLEFPSFYLELTVLAALQNHRLGATAQNFLTVLQYLSSRFVNARVLDPANTNNVVSDELTAAEKQTIAQAASQARAQRSWGSIIW